MNKRASRQQNKACVRVSRFRELAFSVSFMNEKRFLCACGLAWDCAGQRGRQSAIRKVKKGETCSREQSVRHIISHPLIFFLQGRPRKMDLSQEVCCVAVLLSQVQRIMSSSSHSSRQAVLFPTLPSYHIIIRLSSERAVCGEMGINLASRRLSEKVAIDNSRGSVGVSPLPGCRR